jgi:hypothetical protein
MSNCNSHSIGNCGQGNEGFGNKSGCQGSESGFHRQFISRAEKIEKLEKYKEELNKELIGVEEQIKKLS